MAVCDLQLLCRATCHRVARDAGQLLAVLPPPPSGETLAPRAWVFPPWFVGFRPWATEVDPLAGGFPVT
eukprot:14598671-Alexandrium_andersonii.AAC.1